MRSRLQDDLAHSVFSDLNFDLCSTCDIRYDTQSPPELRNYALRGAATPQPREDEPVLPPQEHVGRGAIPAVSIPVLAASPPVTPDLTPIMQPTSEARSVLFGDLSLTEAVPSSICVGFTQERRF